MKNNKEFELVENREMRESMMDNVGVLDKVKDLLLLPNTEYATTDQVAEYYEVDKASIRQITKRNNDELESDGIQCMSGNDVKEMYNTSDKMSQVSNIVDIKSVRGGILFNDVKVAYSNNILFPKRAILRVGMLLRDSEIAKEVRTRLLDIIHDTEQQAPEIINNIVSEMTEEQQLVLEKVNAEIAGDYDRVSYINAKLFALKNRRIAELETENNHIKTHALTILESRAVINRIVRTIAMREYGSMFGNAWGDLYSKVNYILGINIKLRKKKKGESLLNTLTEEETFEVEKIVRSWAVEVGLDLDEILKIA